MDGPKLVCTGCRILPGAECLVNPSMRRMTIRSKDEKSEMRDGMESR
jgi:hypothetical protein